LLLFLSLPSICCVSLVLDCALQGLGMGAPVLDAPWTLQGPIASFIITQATCKKQSFVSFLRGPATAFGVDAAALAAAAVALYVLLPSTVSSGEGSWW
jgi:hypothetical protein